MEKASMRDGFGAGLVQAAEKDPQVVGVTADLRDSVKMTDFASKFPFI